MCFKILNWFFRFKQFTSPHEIIDLLCKMLVQHPEQAFEVRIHFSSLLLPIVSQFLEDHGDSLISYQRKCVAVSILAETNLQVLR